MSQFQRSFAKINIKDKFNSMWHDFQSLPKSFSIKTHSHTFSLRSTLKWTIFEVKDNHCPIVPYNNLRIEALSLVLVWFEKIIFNSFYAPEFQFKCILLKKERGHGKIF